MGKIKKGLKEFWEENKGMILFGAVSVACAYCGIRGFNKGYRNGVWDGAIACFDATIEWFDKEFPDQCHLKELAETFAKEHPEEMITYMGNGKWSK